jgi:hypothetical protein
MCGVVFKIFLETLRSENFYFLFLVVFSFLVIESVQGLKLFTFTMISIVLYYFIIPKIKHLFSSSILSEFVFILLFYVGVYLSTLFYIPFEMEFIWILALNFLIDSFVVGFIL